MRIRRGRSAKGRKGALRLTTELLLLAVCGLLSACGANENILKSGKESPQANVENKTPFAQELEAMRTADFSFIYVLRRKDGGKIDAEDRGVIKVQTSLANRRVAADDDKAFIIGSNTQLPPQNMMVLYDRFAVENYSPPPPPNSNTNVNGSTNSNSKTKK